MGHEVNQSLSSLQSLPSDVRGQSDIVHGVERIVGARRLHVLNIKSSARDDAASQGAYQVSFRDDTSTRCQIVSHQIVDQC